MLLILVLIAQFAGLLVGQSPCPDILQYDPITPGQDRYNVTVRYSTDEELFGLWINVMFNRKTQALGSWFSDVTTRDNQNYYMRIDNYQLKPNDVVVIKFFVKYSEVEQIPRISALRINGHTVCRMAANATAAKPPTAPAAAAVTATALAAVEVTTSTTTTTTTQRPTTTAWWRPTTTAAPPVITAAPARRTTPTAPTTEFDAVIFPGDIKWLAKNLRANEDAAAEDVWRPPDFARPNDQRVTTADDAEDDQPQCGVPLAIANPLITLGAKSEPGQWPWHAAIHYKQKYSLTYVCGGTLITPRHVLTAAHCVTVRRTARPISQANLLVELGMYERLDWTNAAIQRFQVQDINIHPLYSPSTYFEDIAILTLSQSAQMTDFVRTACLWEGDANLRNIIDKYGTVVGWGYTEAGKNSEELRHAKMPVVGFQECLLSNREFFAKYLSSTNYCAGDRKGTSPCNGDSGGGMFFRRPNSNIWQIRGIVSASTAQLESTCDTSNFVLFTDVPHFTQWIKDNTGLR